ncbi:hypothetical protein RJ640_002480 [Escallonia rubra]|uniref:J domain-containing protein n=1 Tax=Escallonia rubra TaxID=112253 RepID=A0AA88RU78_9ASTE|nr:hypothetical protein RJ640_002480 [Escallonia rubra]
MALLGKQCQYKVLGLGGDCTTDEIHSTYRRLALQCHANKLAQVGVSPVACQELIAAYKVFFDPREWVDWLLLKNRGRGHSSGQLGVKDNVFWRLKEMIWKRKKCLGLENLSSSAVNDEQHQDEAVEADA